MKLPWASSGVGTVGVTCTRAGCQKGLRGGDSHLYCPRGSRERAAVPVPVFSLRGARPVEGLQRCIAHTPQALYRLPSGFPPADPFHSVEPAAPIFGFLLGSDPLDFVYLTKVKLLVLGLGVRVRIRVMVRVLVRVTHQVGCTQGNHRGGVQGQTGWGINQSSDAEWYRIPSDSLLPGPRTVDRSRMASTPSSPGRHTPHRATGTGSVGPWAG